MSGASGAWDSCQFNQPIAAQLGGIYVVIEFPTGSGYSHPGVGGGAGIGYGDVLLEPRGWISGDGEEWLGLSDNLGFAVIPELVPYVDGMMVKSLGDQGEDGAPEIPDGFYGEVAPNPFNPVLSIKFGLVRASEVEVDVYDVRGRHVANVMEGPMLAGHHSIRWFGEDNEGRAVASGVYFIRIDSGRNRVNRRVTLIK